MITVKNYQDNKNSVNWSKMPQAVQENREGVEEIMEFYDDDTDIKETVDIFLKQINDAQSKTIDRAKIDNFKKENPIEIIDARKKEFENGSILKSEKVNGTKIEIIAKGSKFQFSIDGKGSDIGSYDEMLKKYSDHKKVLEATELEPKAKTPKKTTQPKPKFKVGDIVKSKNDNSDINLYIIHHVNKVNSVKAKVLDDDSSKEYIFFEDEIVRVESAKKEIKSQPTKKVQAVVEKRYLDNYSTEFQLIKRFWNVIKDKKIVLEFRKAQLLYAAFNKAAVERKVRKTSEAAEIFNACNQRMKKLFEEFMLPTQSDVKVDFDNATLYNKIQDYVANVTIDPTVGMLKRFISLQNTLPEIKKAETFLKSLQRTKEKYPDSRLSKELSDAIKALQDYIKNPKEPIEVENYGLSKPKVKVIKKKKVVRKEKNEPIKSVTIKSKSLKKKPTAVKKTVAKPVQKPKVVSKPVVVKKPVLMSKIKKPIVKLSSPVVPLVDVPRIDAVNIKTVGKIKSINDTGREQNNFFTVHGQVGKFLQQVERKPFESVVITLDGMQGAGKTTTLYKFIDAFASAGNSSLFISGEEHPESSLAVEKRDKYLSSEAKKHTAIVGDVDSIEQLYQYVKPYDIIFIDSWQKLQRMVGNIRLDEDLRKKFNGKVFVVIFQQTTTGRTKGGAEVVFDGDIIIKMVKEASFSDNYAYFDKNRYTRIPIENIRYNIANGEVYNPNQEEEEEIQEPVTQTAMPGPRSGFAFQV